VNQFVWNDGISDVFMDSYGRVRFDVMKSDDGIVSSDLTEPQSLFPQNTNESEGAQVLQNGLYTGLISFTPDGTQVLANAESFTSDDGGLNWTVVLKDGWSFTNGEPVTAKSYVDAWNLGAKASLGMQTNSFFKPIAGYEAYNEG
jgi:oligopeptide transport system substrate-binding protein